MSQVVTELPVLPLGPEPSTSSRTADRIGVVASVLCAIHCAATPFLLLLLPTFGKAWSHPATHWGMALLVVPLAGFMIRSSYKKYGRKWIVGAGTAGILFILCGAAAPYVEEPPGSAAATEAEGGTPDQNAVAAADDEDPCEGCALCAANEAGEDSEAEVCTDNCCPSLQEAEDGSWTLNIPTASILTTLGGAFLIATHIGNLRLCQCCDSSSECETDTDGEAVEE